MKKVFILVTVLLLVLSLNGCSLMLMQMAAMPAEPTEPTVVTEPTQPEKEWPGFNGTDYKYVYLYEEGRERAWEEDLVYMAANYIDDYGRLSRFPFPVKAPDDSYLSDEFYEPELQQYWIEETNAMIRDIPNMTDTEILYRIQKLVATLEDGHASIYLPRSPLFPIGFVPFFREDGMDVRAVMLPKAQEDALFTKLVAINGVPVEEVVTRLEPYMSYENEAWLMTSIFHCYCYSYATQEDILVITGIQEKAGKSVTYTLESDDGKVFDLELRAESSLDYSKLTGMLPMDSYSQMYKDMEHYYWYEAFPQEDMIYLRINEFTQDDSYTFLNLGNDMLKDVRANGGKVGKLIVDLRDNPGGLTFAGYHEFVNVLKRIDIGQVYVLVDSNTFSNGIIMAATIKREIPESLWVGTPAGQPPNFYGGMSDGDFVMPNCDVIIRMPTSFNKTLPDYEGDTLMPDLLVYPTIEDYKNGVDTVLEAVRALP